MEMSKTFNQIRAYARSRHLPIIPIDAKNISLLHEPESFYRTILSCIESAESRLALSALYLGTGFREKALVKAIYNKVERNKSLKVDVVLDSNRAKRLDENNESSMTVLKKLSSFPSVNISLIQFNRTGSIINRFMQRIQKWNELWSTYHAKMLIYDDNLIFTGANLSGAYFDKRQDRYILLKNSKHLSSYMLELLNIIKGDNNSLKTSIYHMNERFVEKLVGKHNTSTTMKTEDSYIIPLMQHGTSGIKDLEDFLAFLNSILPENAHMHLSTGYFNPSPTISKLNIKSIIAPSEEANGFFGGKGGLGHVPRLYSAIQKHYIQTHKSCELFLYVKPQWSYHAKGIWVEGLKDFYIHLIGSSNFNLRSCDRDFEIQLVIMTSNENLINELTQEHDSLKRESKPVCMDGLPNSYSLHGILSNLLKSYL